MAMPRADVDLQLQFEQAYSDMNSRLRMRRRGHVYWVQTGMRRSLVGRIQRAKDAVRKKKLPLPAPVIRAALTEYELRCGAIGVSPAV